MSVYFCGQDSFKCVPLSEEKNNYVSTPRLISKDWINIKLSIGHIVFQKYNSSNPSELELDWFVRGLRIPTEQLLFNKDLNISKVCIASNYIVGLNSFKNVLYYVSLTLDRSRKDFSLLISKAEQIVKSDTIRITDIVTNDKMVYALDDNSCIYEVTDSLLMKWKFENITIKKLACGFGHFIVINDTGALYSWGFGGRGELGHAEHDHVMVLCESPKRIEFFDDLPCVVKDVCCGGWMTSALTSDGDIYSWGWNESGQLGHSEDKRSDVGGVPYPVDLGSAEDPVEKISCGARHAVAVLKSGKLFSWGMNKYGQLGVGDFNNRQEPTKVLYQSIGKCEISCGRWHTFIRQLK